MESETGLTADFVVKRHERAHFALIGLTLIRSSNLRTIRVARREKSFAGKRAISTDGAIRWKFRFLNEQLISGR